jgi:hypothetical protein
MIMIAVIAAGVAIVVLVVFRHARARPAPG